MVRYGWDFGDALDFNQGIQGILPDSDRRAGGFMGVEHLGVDLVHPLEIRHVLEINSCFHHILQRKPQTLEDDLDIFQGSFGLLANLGSDDFHSLRVERRLPRAEYQVAGLGGVAVRADGLWGVVNMMNLHLFLHTQAADFESILLIKSDCRLVMR